MRGREAADAAADDDQVVGFAGLGDRPVNDPRVAQCMGRFERARMAAAHAEPRRWVVAGAILFGDFGGGGNQLRCESAEQYAAHADRRALQEVASRDGRSMPRSLSERRVMIAGSYMSYRRPRINTVTPSTMMPTASHSWRVTISPPIATPRTIAITGLTKLLLVAQRGPRVR